MNLKNPLILTCIILICFVKLEAQIVINEASNKNYTQIFDEDGDNEDWIELYNTSDSAINLKNWYLSDDLNDVDKWPIPNLNLKANSTQLFFASDKDNRICDEGYKWQCPVLPTDSFTYIIPDETTSSNWNTIEYNDQSWNKGIAGFGFGDDDDNTIVPNDTRVIYIRKLFSIPDTQSIADVVCHIDYDDGFVAYLNGTEICRSNISGQPDWNSFASNQHDAVMVEGNLPEKFDVNVDLVRSVWKEGTNIFAIEVHNINANSSDLSLIPFLSFKIPNESNFFNNAPSWLTNSMKSKAHTNFKISSKGEIIFLFNPQKELVDFLQVSGLQLNHSIGRSTDGADILAIFENATPGESNNASTPYTNGYEDQPIFNTPAGFYSDPLNITLSKSSETSEIRYTTDGSTPDSSSTLYNGHSIQVSSTQTINARCFSTGDKLPGKTQTATYFIDENFTVPVLAVTTDDENLYGPSGIFTNWEENWNKPSYVEYFDTSKKLAFSQQAGIQIDGGAGGSRSKPQHSFRIEPGHGIFGSGDIEYALQPDRPKRDSYSSFYVRNGSNQNLILPYKDALQVKALGKNTFNYYSAYRPIVVFINGSYFGVYELREKINDDYLEQNYDMDTDSLDLIGVSHFKGQTLQAITGSIEPFLEDYDHFMTLDPKSANFLQDVDKFLDLKNYTDYIIAQSWVGNVDWPQNNIKLFRCKSTDYRWQFTIIDLEMSFLPNQWSTAAFDHIQYLNNIGTSNCFTAFWYKMMQNNEYKFNFINRFADLMNTSYSFDVIGQLENEMYNEIFPEMAGEYERWGTSNIQAQLNTFTSNHNIFRSELEIRSSYVREDLQQHYNLDNQIDIVLDVKPKGAGKIKISTVMPDSYPWKGIYFSNVPLRIEAVANHGYSFAGWDNNKYISDPSSNVFTSAISDLNNIFNANFEPEQSTFEGITISEINYKDGEDFNTTDWFEIWNATNENLDLEGWYFTDNDADHRFNFSSGTTIPAGKRIVVVHSIKNFTSNYPDVDNFTGEFSFKLGTPLDAINLFNNNDELVVSVNYSDNYPWPLSDDISGRTLELLNPESSLSDYKNWFKGCYKGSPGEAYDATCGGQNSSSPVVTLNSNNTIIAYPNPANNNVYLQFNLTLPVTTTIIKVYDVMGKMLKSETFGAMNSGYTTINFDISDLKTGQMYFIKVSTDQFQQTVKIVKN